jgi:hypothetical protein
MLRKLTDRLSSAAASVLGTEDPKVQRLVGLGFDATRATNALQAANGNVDRAAELLLSNSNASPSDPELSHSTEDATIQRIMQESLHIEQRRQQNDFQEFARASPVRTAAMNKAAEAAARRADGVGVKPLRSNSGGLSTHHPQVKLIPKLQDKTKEEQILRCADRLKASHQAVDTLYRALTAVQKNSNNPKFRKIDKNTVGYQKSVATAPGAEDLLAAMNYRPQGTHTLVLDRAMVDPALLYLGVSALEQTKLTPEYQQSKAKGVFSKTVREIQQLADTSEAEAIARAALMAKCPTEPAEGRGALIQVIVAEDTLRRRFDGDDTLQDVLNWLGSHGTDIPVKILSREWCLVDLNRYPAIPMDCAVNKGHTIQFIGCWPSGKLEVLPSTEEWREGSRMVANGRAGSSRGLGSAPSDLVYQS